MNKVRKGLFLNISNEVIWSQKIQIPLMGKKVPFWQFLKNRLIGWIGWIGHALLVQPSKTAHIFFSLLYLNFHLFFKI